jgi:hypothetical protein
MALLSACASAGVSELPTYNAKQTRPLAGIRCSRPGIHYCVDDGDSRPRHQDIRGDGSRKHAAETDCTTGAAYGEEGLRRRL